jgi:hypothetical protein
MPSKGSQSNHTRLILSCHQRGLTVNDIILETGAKKGAIYTVLYRNNLKPNGKIGYDWAEVQAFYDQGNSTRACIKHFGMCTAAITKAVRTGRLKTRSLSDAMILGHKLGTIKVSVMSEEEKARQSERAKARGLGGETNYYKYKYAGVNMDSQWEVDVAIWLDSHKIVWERNKRHVFSWIDTEGESHRYYPDFYLPAHNVYLDPKNKYLIEKDRLKIETVMKTHSIKIIWGLKGDVIAALISLIQPI